MDDLQALLKKAQELNKARKFDEVVELLTDSVLKTHNDADLYAEKAEALWKLHKYELSYETAEIAFNINTMQTKANHYKGNFYNYKNEYEKATEYYNKAIEIDSSFTPSYSGLGNVYQKLEEYKKAIEYYNKAIEIDSSFAPPYSGLGSVYQKLEEYEKATEYCNKAIEIDPQFAPAYNVLGNTYNYFKEYESAIEYYRKAIEIDPQFASPYYNLGSIKRQLNEYEKAIEYYNKAIEIDPQYAPAYNGLGNTYKQFKEYKKAIEYYNKAIELDHNYAPSYYNLGNTYFNIREYDNAISAFKKRLEFSKRNKDYFALQAGSRIAELNKILKDAQYSAISEVVDKIRELLIYKKGRITHYTSLSVAKSLILDSSLFRISEGTFLNDTSEGRELFKYLSFDFPSKRDGDTLATPFTQKPFIGSFVAEIKQDDLTLWRMYGKEEKEEAKGCAITIDIKRLVENLQDKMETDKESGVSSESSEDFSFYKVAYRQEGKECKFLIPGSDEETEDKLNKCMKELFEAVRNFILKEDKDESDIQNVAELLNEIAYLFKSAEYQYEYEVRLVIKGIGFEKIIDPNSIPPRVYIELVESRPLIRKITLGPKVERPDEWAAAFNYSLAKDGYEPEILISHLPFK